jgi:hypothetical protein
METETQYEKLQAIGKSAFESITEMVAALECDFDRLEELREARDDADDAEAWKAENEADAEELAELESQAGDCESREDAEQRISDDPLSVEVRSSWVTPGEEMTPTEFCILLGTGGPATRIRGELDEHGEPDRAWLEAQDWGTPWTQYQGGDQDALLIYSRQFCFAY